MPRRSRSYVVRVEVYGVPEFRAFVEFGTYDLAIVACRQLLSLSEREVTVSAVGLVGSPPPGQEAATVVVHPPVSWSLARRQGMIPDGPKKNVLPLLPRNTRELHSMLMEMRLGNS